MSIVRGEFIHLDFEIRLFYCLVYPRVLLSSFFSKLKSFRRLFHNLETISENTCQPREYSETRITWAKLFFTREVSSTRHNVTGRILNWVATMMSVTFSRQLDESHGFCSSIVHKISSATVNLARLVTLSYFNLGRYNSTPRKHLYPSYTRSIIIIT